MKKLGLITLTLALLIGVCSLSAFAVGDGLDAGVPGPAFCGPGPEGPGSTAPPHPGPAPALDNWDGLKLTPDQQQKILEIRQNFATECQPLRFAIQKNALQLKQLWSENPLNGEAIAALEQQNVLAQVKMINLSRDMQKQIEAVLTPAQLKELQKRRPPQNPPQPHGRFRGEPSPSPRGCQFPPCPPPQQDFEKD